MNGAENTRAGTLLLCPGPWALLPGQRPTTLATQESLASIHGTWPTHSSLACQTDAFVPNNAGGGEAATSAAAVAA
jgi:hypothetical protein